MKDNDSMKPETPATSDAKRGPWSSHPMRGT